MAEITKGNWEKKGNKIEVLGRGIVAVCPSPTNADGVLEFIANAHLIAAAPDMLEALNLIWGQVEVGNIKMGIYHKRLLKQVLVKAKGEEVK